MIGERLSHYKVVGKLGAGGMGVVYKAEDTRLERLVAIKLIPAELLGDQTIKHRFVNEARAASALDHQNICRIHHIDETPGGELYLVMAYYAGQTLAERLRGAPLPIEQAVDLARQLAAGLAHAHEAGIVHRDVKPANLLITERGELKILDFGLAKLAGELGITRPGHVIGTLAYMSPEQAQGKDVDLRTDIWSSGVVLHEMLTGSNPFLRDNLSASLRAILDDQPPAAFPPTEESPALEAVLRRALAKDRLARFDSMAQMERALRGLSSGSMPTATVLTSEVRQREHSIVVLPFNNLSADAESDYFCDGLTDEVITDLSGLEALRVIAPGSSMRLKGSGKKISEIARELDVQYVLDGSIRRHDENVRINARLVDAATESLLWAGKYRGTMRDVFDIQEELSRKIVEALELTLSDDEEQRLADHPVSDVYAYECYLKAKHERLRYTRGALERALEYLQDALERTGENVYVLSALGHVHWQFVNGGISSDHAYLDRTRECAERILAIDPEAAHGLRLQGMLAMLEGDSQAAVKRLKAALERDPNDTDTLGWLTACYGYVGKPWIADPLVKRLLRLDPLTPVYQCMPGFLALMAGEFERALAVFERGQVADAGNPIIRMSHGHLLALAGRDDEACVAFDALAEEMPDSLFAQLGQFYRHALRGDVEAARRSAGEDLQRAAAADPQYSWHLAECFALIGDADTGLDWLERAVERGFLNYPLISRLDPFLDGLRGEPRFATLADRTRAGWEAFEV